MAVAQNLTSTAAVFQTLSAELKEIRVLIVEPGTGNDAIKGRLSIESLLESPCPSYETISYCWGDSTPVVEAWLNGVPMRVPASSVAALRRMRLPQQERRLWIDAICINQIDEDEKAFQIALMSLVYRSGMSNLIFLGDDDNGVAQKTAGALTAVSKYIKQVWEEAAPEDFERMRQDYIVPAKFGSPTSISGFLALEPLFALPWFGRIWVLQEAVLATQNECHWGSVTFPLEELINISFLYNMVPGAVYRTFEEWTANACQNSSCTFWMSTFMPQYRSMRMPLSHEIHHMSRHFSSTEPRDKIFALLALLQDDALRKGISVSIPSDYRQPLRELYRDATRFVLHCCEAPIILGSLSHRSEAEMVEAGRTSWTYLWERRPTDQDPLDFGHTLDSHAFSKHKTNFEVVESEDPDVLLVPGFVVDTTDWMLPVLSPDHMVTATRLATFIQKCVQRTGSNKEATKIASKVLTLGYHYNTERGTASEAQHTEAFHDFLGHVLTTQSLSAWDGRFLAQIYFDIFPALIRNRCVFMTRDGLFGAGPLIMQEGDIIALFAGGCFTSILRPCEDGFRFVGPAYVYTLNEDFCNARGLERTLLKIR